MFGYVTDEQFVKLQERWEKTNVDNLDSRIVPTVIKLAKHPDLVPVWSCSGHDAKEQKEKKPNKKTVAMLQNRYIYFVVRQGHTKIFENYDKYINNIAWDDFFKIRPHLTSFLLNYGFVDRDKDLTTFNVWGIKIDYKLCNYSFRNEYGVSPKWVENLWNNLIDSLLEE